MPRAPSACSPWARQSCPPRRAARLRPCARPARRPCHPTRDAGRPCVTSIARGETENCLLRGPAPGVPRPGVPCYSPPPPPEKHTHTQMLLPPRLPSPVVHGQHLVFGVGLQQQGVWRQAAICCHGHHLHGRLWGQGQGWAHKSTPAARQPCRKGVKGRDGVMSARMEDAVPLLPARRHGQGMLARGCKCGASSERGRSATAAGRACLGQLRVAEQGVQLDCEAAQSQGEGGAARRVSARQAAVKACTGKKHQPRRPADTRGGPPSPNASRHVCVFAWSALGRGCMPWSKQRIVACTAASCWMAGQGRACTCLLLG